MRLTFAHATLALLLLAGCGEDPVQPDPDPDPEPQVQVDGFRMMRGASAVFTWSKSDPAEADTLELTWNQPIGVRFVWLDGAGDSVDVGANAQLLVNTGNDSYATWTPTAVPFTGTFGTGGYPEVETSFRVRLLIGSTVALNAPNLVLHVSP